LATSASAPAGSGSTAPIRPVREAAVPATVEPSARMSVARVVVLVALAIQFLGIAYSIFVQPGLAEWIRQIQLGNTPIIAGTIVFISCLFLLYPIARGSRLALILTVLVLALLVPAALPPLAFNFPRPASFTVWILTTTITLCAVAGIGFGVVALLEAFGRLRVEGFRVAGGGLSRRGVLAIGLAAAWVGMVILAYAVAQVPSTGAGIAGVPEATLRGAMQGTRFTPDALAVRAGQPTAIFLTNHDAVAHSFDVDSLDVHVLVPAGGSAMSILKAPTAGDIRFYCAVPGHQQAGMIGTLSVR
jgi:uncharacterized cupredoxin-like copper-binding protein